MTLEQADIDDLVDLEERFWLQGAGNPDFWRRYFTDEGLVALPIGILDKSRTLRAMEQARPWDRVAMRDVRVVEISPTSAVMTYSASAARDGETDDYVAIIGSVYARGVDGWRLCFHQQSPTTGPST